MRHLPTPDRGFTTHRGFTLVELLTAMAIIALLATIAIPSFRSYLRTSNRTDATRTLMQDAQALQRCYSQNFTYINAGPTPCSVVAGTTFSANNYYSVTVTINNASSYTLQAVPNGPPQSQDSACQTFTLQSSGQQTSLSAAAQLTTQTCWGSN
jgi:type IV pilus assembly protein PilE